jgi:MYXO-CTERM domain-containing protein
VSGATLKQPDNWTSPIDYSNGTIHFYQEVEIKPSKLVTIIDFCFISGGGYGCIETLPYTDTGVHETMRSMAPGGDWYQRNQINFKTKLSSIQMVLKDPATYTNGCPNKADCLPSKMRFVATIVSPGGTYQRPTPSPGVDPGPGGGTADGGAPPVTADAAVTPPAADADVTPPVTADAAVAPPVTADAAAADPKPAKPDAAATKPPTTTPPDETDPDPAPAARKSSGCAVGGASTGGGFALMAVGLLLALRRRARR